MGIERKVEGPSVDPRLLEDDDFLDFFLDEDERRYGGVPQVWILDEDDEQLGRMCDFDYVDELYRAYRQRPM